MVEKQIRIDVTLDDRNIPEAIVWDADDAKEPIKTEASAMLLFLWDKQSRGSVQLPLWTKEMTVDEMKLFFHETLLSMADTLERSIADPRISGDMKDFCAYFAEKMEIAQQGS